MAADIYQEKPLHEVLEFYNGKSVKPGGTGLYPIYGSNGIIGGSDDYKYENAVILGRVGAYCGSVAYCPTKFWASDNTIVVTPKKGAGDVRYYYYLLTHLDLHRWAGGAAQPLLTQTVLKTVEAPIAESDTQQKIASILSAYDDLIENNLKRIKILEEMAQMIYREWFVNFRFPGYEKVKMVKSDMGMIPEGWEVKKVGDILSTLESGSRPRGGVDPNERGVPSIGAENILGLGQYDYSDYLHIRKDFFLKMNRGHIKSGDVLLYKDGAKIGRKSLFRDGFPHEVCCINEHVFILRTNSLCTQNYLYFWLDQPEMTNKIINLNANAAQPGINQAGVNGLPVLLPFKESLDMFEETSEPILAELFNLSKKNNLLRQTRDLLLPKLISGEIDVEGLDINISHEVTK